MAGQDKRLLPLMPMGSKMRNVDKERPHGSVIMLNQESQQELEEEREEGEFVHGDDLGAEAAKAFLALVPGLPSQIDVRIDVTLLHCHACFQPLKPPVFKCDSGHMVCCYCRGGHNEVCGRADIHSGDIDAFICASKVPCSYKGFGCDCYVIYYEAEAHMRTCHYAPCKCPEPSCGFLGSPSTLLDHFYAYHSWPIIVIRYGWTWKLSLPLSQCWHIIVGQEDQSVFLVNLGDIGNVATAVSLVCVRADYDATAAPKFCCKLSVEHPCGENNEIALMTSNVRSTTMIDGAPMPGHGMFLAVPHELKSREMLAINVRIDQVNSLDASTMAKTMPPPHVL